MSTARDVARLRHTALSPVATMKPSVERADDTARR
jgi:hypothetical protein